MIYHVKFELGADVINKPLSNAARNVILLGGKTA